MGHAVGRWENGALVIDTIGFNDRTWLNDSGAPHSAELHLVERIRPVLRPYTYVRYFQKLDTELADDVCQDEE